LEDLLSYSHYIIALLVIFLVFIQPSKAGAGNLLSSGGNNTEKKFDFLTKFTLVAVLLFLVVSFSIPYYQAMNKDTSVVQELNIKTKEGE